MRGRGGVRVRGRPTGSYARPAGHRQFVPHVPFDLLEVERAFPRVAPAVDDKAFTEALLKRNQDLSPTPAEQTAISSLVAKVQAVIDALVIAPDGFDSAVVEEARTVGAFKKGTMMIGRNVADIVLILRTLPTREAVQALGTKLLNDLRKQEAKEVLSLIPNEEGFDIRSSDATIKCLIATIPPNIAKLDPDIHMPARLMAQHLAAVRHSRWFDESATHSSIKVLIRLLKDLTERIEGLDSLTPWMIDLLAHHAIMNNPSLVPLPINQAFRRVLQLLASGLFLPGSIGIIDPCEMGGVRCHVNMLPEDMDTLCLTAQTLSRVLAQNGYRQILELEGASEVATVTSVWDGVVVTPSEKTYVNILMPLDDEEEEQSNS